MVTTPDRELEETPKPSSKSSGKHSDKKLEVQTRMLDILERDLDTEADPLAMQFDVMAKRVKNELPRGKQFSIALRLAGIVDEEIRANQQRQMVVNTALAPPAVPFQLQTTVSQPQAVTPPPSPMMHRDGGGFFHEWQLNFQDL